MFLAADRGDTEISAKCPKCGNTQNFSIGSFKFKDGKMSASSITCLDCGHKQGDAKETT